MSRDYIGFDIRAMSFIIPMSTAMSMAMSLAYVNAYVNTYVKRPMSMAMSMAMSMPMSIPMSRASYVNAYVNTYVNKPGLAAGGLAAGGRRRSREYRERLRLHLSRLAAVAIIINIYKSAAGHDYFLFHRLAFNRLARQKVP